LQVLAALFAGVAVLLLTLTSSICAAQRIAELFPRLDTTRWKAGKPRTVKRLSDLIGLGLQPTARWSTPGGRQYALYGLTHPDAAVPSRQ
jgi:hypothetical protein